MIRPFDATTLKAIERGYIQAEIHEAAYRHQKAVETKEQTVVGVNDFTSEAASDVERMKVDPAVEAQARQRLAAFRAGRDAVRVSGLRARLEAAARGSENLMPLMVECVEQRLTVGEICHTLRGVWGEYRPAA